MEGRVCMKDKQGISLSNFRNNLNKATTFRKKKAFLMRLTGINVPGSPVFTANAGERARGQSVLWIYWLLAAIETLG